MKNLLNLPYRDHLWEETLKLHPMLKAIYGCFYFPQIGSGCQAIASKHAGWEHVSVSFENRCPNFEEMVTVKNFFWEPNEIVFQVHPQKKDYVNYHLHTLHMWRPLNINVTIPNADAVLFRYDFLSTTTVYKYGRTQDGEYIAIYNPTWATWNELCKIKQSVFGDDVAIQFQKDPRQDINEKHIIILWKHKNNFPLPPNQLVI